jgi:hypothetical protein
MRRHFQWALAFGLASVAAAQAEPRIYAFTWAGQGGYEMRGALAFESARTIGLITESEVDCFVIEGFLNGQPLGRWALGMLNEDTTWTLAFDPVTEGFVVFGSLAIMPQGWNMNGGGTDCGNPGFGFNIGNAAQDLCVNGELIFESQVDPSRPFPAKRVATFPFPADVCLGPKLIG